MRGDGPVSAWWDFIISSADLLGGLEEHRKLTQWGLGRSPSRKRFLDVLYAILCDFTCVLVHFGS